MGIRQEGDNVEDRRGMRMSPGVVGGGLGTIVLIVLALIFGVDPRLLLQSAGTQSSVQQPSSATQLPANDPLAQFVSVVLADTEDTWSALFRQAGAQYENPKLVLFSGAVQSACGFAQAAVGPFYCPADHKFYIDLDFYRDLRDRFHAPGDFAQAYVIAHEVGHHVQNQLGISDRVRAAQQRGSQQQANAPSVRMELQADCLAGVWRTTPTARATSSSKATSKRRSTRPARSVMTECRSAPAAMFRRSPSRTAPRSSASSGSGAGWRAATSNTATRSRGALSGR